MTTYLVTGGAGFIGSNIARTLAQQGDTVRVLDNLFTGFSKNLDDIRADIDFIEGSILDETILAKAMDGVDYCLHQAAIGSVPRSLKDPIASNEANVEGSMRVYLAARDAGVKRVVSASSSSVYGDHDIFPTTEDTPLNPISPYAISKMAAERYAAVFSEVYGIDIVRMRYFNVFGPYQNPDSEYSAVIPKFIRLILEGKKPLIHGDGSQSRDFTYVDNVVDANLKACVPEQPIAGGYNIAYGATASILEIATTLCTILGAAPEMEFTEGRVGDVPKSLASIKKAIETFHYEPKIDLHQGLEKTVAWYRKNI